MGAIKRFEVEQRIAIDRDRTPQLIGEFLAVAVGLEQRLVERNHHRARSDVGVINHFHMQGVVAWAAMGMDRHRDHVGRLARHAANGGGAIFGKGADGLGGVDNFEGVQRRGQGGHYIRLGHGYGDVAVAGDGVSAGQDLLWVDVGHGTGGGDLQIPRTIRALTAEPGSRGERGHP